VTDADFWLSYHLFGADESDTIDCETDDWRGDITRRRDHVE